MSTVLGSEVSRWGLASSSSTRASFWCTRREGPEEAAPIVFTHPSILSRISQAQATIASGSGTSTLVGVSQPLQTDDLVHLLARRFPHRVRLSDSLTVPGRTVRAHVLLNLLEYLPEQEHQGMAGAQLEQPLALGKVGQRLLIERIGFSAVAIAPLTSSPGTSPS